MLNILALFLGLVPQQAPETQPRIHPALVEAFADSAADTKFRVYAVLGERMRASDFAGVVDGMPRKERSAHVAATLRAFADQRQGGLLALLADLEQEGQVERVRQLWVVNSVVFHGTRSAIERVAALPEVERVGWDPARAPEEYQDAGGFTTYYSQDFEGGIGLPPEFSSTTTGCGFASVLTAHGPKSGLFHLVMASDTDSCNSTASVTLTVDLSTAATAKLRYGFKDMADEFTSGADILEASDDGGATWTKIADLTGTDGAYLTKTHDLDGLGLSYVSDFLIRWSWSDNFTPPTDGFGIDDIAVADDFPPPPAPEPEVNLVQLQAPDLWDLGYDGTGSVILNIDSGVDDGHPDLENRVWTNPNDPVDGIDNDGNGFVDDVKGWDFSSDDNDPDPSGATHGTNTAGIMVGDGSSGVFQTGMAPGAMMAVARINGESDHWGALQWGISVGVDCSSSSHSYKWYFNPKPDYHMHREVAEMVQAAGIIHANSIGNDGGSGSAPVPFNISAPGLSPSPWKHSAQSQVGGGVSGIVACGGIELNDTHYSFSGSGPSAWEDLTVYDAGYEHAQDSAYWDYPVGGFGGSMQGQLKPDVVTYTNVATTTNGGGFSSSFGGTSAATPHLGGAFALLTAAQPEAAPRHVAQAVQVSAEDMGAPGKDPVFGAGKLQVLDAAKRLLHLVRLDDLTPSIGETVDIRFFGFPGEAFRGFFSLSGYGATPLGAIGALDVAPPVTELVTSALDASGEFTFSFDVPNNPALVGTDVYIQSIEDNRLGLTGEVLFSTVELVTVAP